MGAELNWTYKCPNPKHTKTVRRNKFLPTPICPICNCKMEKVIYVPKNKKQKHSQTVGFKLKEIKQ